MLKNNRIIKGSDGTAIAWAEWGEGPPLIFVNGFTTSNFFWRYLIKRLKGRARLITWDLKGHGHSAPAQSLEGCRIEALVEDMKRVMDAAGVKRAPLLGFSMGCQIILEAWRHMPERIAALLPILGTAGRVFDDFLPPILGPLLGYSFQASSQRAFARGYQIVSRVMMLPGAHELGSLLGVVGEAPKEDILRFREHFNRLDITTIQAMGRAAGMHSAWNLLSTITVPSLVVVGGRDTFTPRHVGLSLAADIPGSELLYLPKAAHTGLFEQPEEINSAIERFLFKRGFLK